MALVAAFNVATNNQVDSRSPDDIITLVKYDPDNSSWTTAASDKNFAYSRYTPDEPASVEPSSSASDSPGEEIFKSTHKTCLRCGSFRGIYLCRKLATAQSAPI